MKLINKTLIAVAFAAASSVACAAPDLSIVSVKSGNGHAMGLEFTSDGNVVGLQFKVKVPEGAVVDTASCGTGLKFGTDHVGVCKYNNVEHYVVGMVFSDTNQAIPRGTFSLGTIGAKSKGNFEVMEFIAADVNAKAIPSTSKMIRDDETNGRIQAK